MGKREFPIILGDFPIAHSLFAVSGSSMIALFAVQIAAAGREFTALESEGCVLCQCYDGAVEVFLQKSHQSDS